MAVNKLVWKIVLDIFILLCVAAPWIAVIVAMEPYRRGYFPNDPSLSLPYKDDKISEVTLAIVGFVVMIATVLITEVTLELRGRGIGEQYVGRAAVPGWLWESYRALGVYTFGGACQQLTLELTKRVIGRLRPNFFAVCQPVPVALSPLNTLGYIQDFNCAGADESMNKEVRLSFYSGHTSYAVYTAVFLMMYLQDRCTWRGSHLLRPALQLAALLAGWYVALSRVVDNMHHWSDVAVGLAAGASFAVIAYVYVLRMKPQKYLSSLPSQWPQTEMPR